MKQIKKLSLSNVISKLTRNEMRYILAGTGYSEGGGSGGVETCNGYKACPSGCIERKVVRGEVKYFCSSCCIA